ncbi:MAG: SDR family NAD(P)-dependent oxidoreductase [Deltaproteobacteria bacterium]|jgi:NAD(P)-dependent dehydrogenase (short-subunit alcohol dehydrogenase family)|nr:SDR family NAD(P)-dependent oxidoreductase [Deltaproteobacteria bacterium]MBT6435526.1 SDR family NAD(P)-dependent oxidoreductase [Deltaproteobacteria bacterium]MBT6491220.1 SDR family NAD(P)-dependent oxidoreductase [Deltaproteobacteria bacterium]
MQSKIPKEVKAVVTGGASGLGRAFCVKLASPGARLVVADIDEEGARETMRLAQDLGAECLFVATDVSKWEEVERLALKAHEWLGSVDLVVNNAGVGVRGSLEKVSLEDWEWVMGINLWGVVYGCRAFIPDMKANGKGAIINIASLAGLASAPKMGPYNISKAAVVSLSETLYAELAHSGIGVSVVCPSFFRTNIMKSGRGDQPPKVRALVDKLMDRSKVQAPEVAAAALSSVFSGKLYVVPMMEARLLWRFKRLFPGFFQRRFALPKRK